MLSLIFPIYRNEQNLPRLFREIGALAERFPAPLELVFVVDGSPDQCLAILRDNLPSWPGPTQLVELSRNFGAFPAIAAGLKQGRGEYFAVMAADLQEPPELILKFYEAMAAGEADVVYGCRATRHDPGVSRLLSAAFWSVYRRFVVRDMPPGGIDVFGCTRAVRNQIAAMGEANTNLIALMLWLGYRRKYVYYDRQPRLEGHSAWTFGKKLRYAIDSIFSFTDLPLKALMILGLTGCAGAVAASGIVFTGWLLGWIPVLGYTPLMLAIAFFGGLTALGLGIIGQYLWLTLQNARRRPSFVVRSAESFDGAGAARTYRSGER